MSQFIHLAQLEPSDLIVTYALSTVGTFRPTQSTESSIKICVMLMRSTPHPFHTISEESSLLMSSPQSCRSQSHHLT